MVALLILHIDTELPAVYWQMLPDKQLELLSPSADTHFKDYITFITSYKGLMW